MKLISQVLLAVAVVVSVAGGLFLVVRGSNSGGYMEIRLPTATPAFEAEMKVHLSGAIRNPGVYSVQEGDRLADVVAAAGGPTEDADLTAVNLAVRVRDAQKYDIPARGELPGLQPAPASPPPGPRAPGCPPSGKIDLNSATAEELKALPNIGDVRAGAIVRYRESNGPFSRVDDVLAVPGIGPATLEAARDSVVVC